MGQIYFGDRAEKWVRITSALTSTHTAVVAVGGDGSMAALVLRPTLPQGRRGVKVAFDDEVTVMRAPLDFRVLDRPLYLVMPQHGGASIDTRPRTARAAM